MVERIFPGHCLGLFQRNPVQSCIHGDTSLALLQTEIGNHLRGRRSAAAKLMESRGKESRMANSAFITAFTPHKLEVSDDLLPSRKRLFREQVGQVIRIRTAKFVNLTR